VRAFDIALAALALRASSARPPRAERKLIPAVDGVDAATLNKTALPQVRMALVASLWPAPTRQCVIPPIYVMLPAPAAFGSVLTLSWAATVERRQGARAHSDAELPRAA
jgi:hypothetical protein